MDILRFELLDVNELLYMSHCGDDVAYRALFQIFVPAMKTKVKVTIQTYQPLHIYRNEFLQGEMLACSTAIVTYRADEDSSFATYANTLMDRELSTVLRSVTRIKTVAAHETCDFQDEVERDNGGGYFNRYQNPFYNTLYCLRFEAAKSRLDHLLDHLKPEEKKMFDLWQSGMPYKKASDELGITLSQYRGRLHRLKTKVKDCVYEPSIC